VSLERGRVVVVALDPTRGHEQRGRRPCVVVSASAVNDDQRYPLLAVVPVTGTRGEGLLYPALASGPSGLRMTSWALVDQVRSVDKRRVASIHGTVAPEELAAIDEGLRAFLGLGE
jgi:mRNA interferase MazF